MKYFLFVFFAVALVSCQNGKSTKKENQTIQTDIELTEVTFSVSGLHCGNCVKSVNKGVGQLAGVESVETSLADSTTMVKFDKSKATIEEIEEAIVKRGFKANVMN